MGNYMKMQRNSSLSVDLLKQVDLPEEIFINVLNKQLKGPAATYMVSQLPGLNLVWKDFGKELLSRFDSEGIKAAVNKKFLTEVEPTDV